MELDEPINFVDSEAVKFTASESTKLIKTDP